MNLPIQTWNIANPEAIEDLVQNPKHRRAPKNALWAIAALEPLMEKLKDDTGIVLASGHGELGVTSEFYNGIVKQNMARPILFQNSLHHSTLGYLTAHFQILGPSLTTSGHYFSGEKALLLADTLIQSEKLSECLVVGVDTLPSLLEKPVQAMSPRSNFQSGAAAIKVGGEKSSAIANFVDIACHETGEQPAPENYYEADAIAHTAQLLEDGRQDGLMLPKPDGSYSTLMLRQP